MASFTFLYTNNDANTTVISARILRKALQNGTLSKRLFCLLHYYTATGDNFLAASFTFSKPSAIIVSACAGIAA
jgi:hypothetical protein